MANILMALGKLICLLFILVLAVLGWKTAEYFNTLPENDKNKPLIAWDVLMLCSMMLYLVVRLLFV